MDDGTPREAAAAVRLVEVMVAHQGHDGVPLRAADELAAAGIPVFPCAPGGKTPLTRHGFKDATTSPRQIARWLSRWPAANVAVATGGNAVDVVDVDAHATGSGFPALERARRAGLVDGWSLVVRTPSGGLHFYYPALRERPQRSWSAGEAHIDFRGAGGYVLTPPSVVQQADGRARAYAVLAVGRDPRPVDAEALKAFLRPPAPAVPASSGSRLRHGAGDRGERIAAWMAARPEGSRNGSLFWAACRFVEQQIPEHEARTLLVDSAMRAGLPEDEAVATVRSAYRVAGPANAGRRPVEGLAR